MKKSVLVSLLFSAIFVIGSDKLSALEHKTSFGIVAAYYFDDNKGYNADDGIAPVSYTPVDLTRSSVFLDEGRMLGSGWGSAEGEFQATHTMTMPFLTGDGALTKGNNLQFKFKGGLSPVSFEATAETLFTPIAFLQFGLGMTAGTGWNAVAFNGLGLNDDGTGNPQTTSFPGVVLKPFVHGTFQFDLSALVPGEWTHIVTQLNARLEYNWFSGAAEGQAWQYKADGGENLNGFRYKGTYFLGYQMPIVLDTVGLLLETNQNIGTTAALSTMESGGWGSDFVDITFGPLFNFSITKQISLAMLIQWETERRFSYSTIGHNYYKNRSYESTYLDLKRIAFVFSYTL